MRSYLLAGVAGLSMLSASAFAQAIDPLAVKFGARASVHSISISPEGKQIVFVGPRAGGGENAVVVDLATTNAIPILSSKGLTEQISHCQFILESRVVCEIYFNSGTNRDIFASTRIVSIANDGSSMKVLTADKSFGAYYNSRYGGSIIDYNVPGDPEGVLMDRWYSPEMGTESLLARKDSGLGVEAVNVTTGRRKDKVKARPTAQFFISDGTGTVRIMGTQPVSEAGYAQRKINLLYADVNGDNWSPFGTVTFESGLSEGFQPEAVDSAKNIVYGFDANAGFKALFARSLDGSGKTTLVLAKPGAEVDGLLRIGRNQRVIGASFVTSRRYSEYFDPEYNALANGLGKALGGDRQIAIVDATADEQKLIVFAGSDVDPGQFYLFDKATKQLGGLMPDRPELKSMTFGTMKSIAYPAADGTMIPASAGRWLVSQGITTSDKLAIFGWSYGGYAALQSAVLDPQLFKAIVAVAPVTDLDKLREEARNYTNFYVRDNEIGNGPHVAAGSPARHADRFMAPVLLFHGDADRNVAVGESRLMKQKLESAGKQVTYVEFAGQAHQLDDSQARSRMLSDSAVFLQKSLGLPVN